MPNEEVNHGTPHDLLFNRITEHIYIGNNMCCQVHFDKTLLLEGIEVDISLEEENLDQPFGVEMFVWLPVADHTAPTQEQLHFGASVIREAVRMNKKMYVHCQNGHGRAPTMVAAYLISEGKSVNEAIELIREKRPVIHLDSVQIEALDAFMNEVQ